MKFWKKLYKYLKGHDKWIEIKVPEYLKNRENNFFKKDEEGILHDIDEDSIRREEE